MKPSWLSPGSGLHWCVAILPYEPPFCHVTTAQSVPALGDLCVPWVHLTAPSAVPGHVCRGPGQETLALALLQSPRPTTYGLGPWVLASSSELCALNEGTLPRSSSHAGRAHLEGRGSTQALRGGGWVLGVPVGVRPGCCFHRQEEHSDRPSGAMASATYVSTFLPPRHIYEECPSSATFREGAAWPLCLLQLQLGSDCEAR